mgnify:CR=1 FL=1
MGMFDWLRKSHQAAALDGTSPATAIVVCTIDGNYTLRQLDAHGLRVGTKRGSGIAIRD